MIDAIKLSLKLRLCKRIILSIETVCIFLANKPVYIYICVCTTDRALLIHIEERVPTIMIYYRSTTTIYAYSIEINFFIGTHLSFIRIIIIRVFFSNYLRKIIFSYILSFITLNIKILKYVFSLHGYKYYEPDFLDSTNIID